MIKPAFVDIGELGWSLYVSAYARWRKKNNQPIALVMTLPDRICLYEELASITKAVPPDFYRKFGRFAASCLGLIGVAPDELKAYFNKALAPDYIITKEMRFGCRPFWPKAHAGRFLYGPYPYKKEFSGPREILVFPRWRDALSRNISKTFYIELTNALCDKFQNHIIRAVGSPNGSYDIKEISKKNYVNKTREVTSIQDLIDRCQIAQAAIGSQSAPPKISLLQGVPTFMIGHQEKRHTVIENWMKTKVGFYSIGVNSYNNFNHENCIEKIIDFVKGCI